MKITRQVIDNQFGIRNELYWSLKRNYSKKVSKYEQKNPQGKVIKIMFEDLFESLYNKMNGKEKNMFYFIRTITDSMAKYNNEMFNLIDSNRDFLEDEDVPELVELYEHLRLWKEKYESKKNNPRMCLVYVGVKENKPFPKKITETAMRKYEHLKKLYLKNAKTQ